jgi:predicted dehydrogenase
MKFGIKKVIRFIGIYGVVRTLVKVAGRLRLMLPLWRLLYLLHPVRSGVRVGIIGCGQFSYSAIAYFLSTSTNSKLLWCVDIDLNAAKSMAAAFGMKQYAEDCTSFLQDTDLVYIASNHSTHTPYAVQCMKAGCDIYIEKPISTTREQFEELLAVAQETGKKIYVGYNRPHAPSIDLIRNNVPDKSLPLSLSCFITGHLIPDGHWYRDPKEGTRVCGNLGHWLDLAVHMMSWSNEPIESVEITISYSNKNTPSDNFTAVICTPRGDLVTLTFSTRGEPFEGVNESINFQQGDLIAKINDHRHTQLWIDKKYISKRHWPKNVGHKNAILQPFVSNRKRQWLELVISTELMLVITGMVQNLDSHCEYEFVYK